MLEQNIRLVRGSPFGSDVSCVNIWLQEEEEEEQEEQEEQERDCLQELSCPLTHLML